MGKELLLDTYQNPSVNPYPKGFKEMMIQMLGINIGELRRILQDVEQCISKEPEFSDEDDEETRMVISAGR
jgi:hypothetical protein